MSARLSWCPTNGCGVSATSWTSIWRMSPPRPKPRTTRRARARGDPAWHSSQREGFSTRGTDHNMPELPEVEYVARQLRSELVGHRIARVEVYWPRIVAAMAPDELAALVAGRMVTSIGRRGKYLLIALEGGETLIIHPRMSGNLTLAPPDAADPYVRAAFALDDGRRLLYSDPRKFGRITLAADADLPRVFAALGPEPLDDETFTAAALAARLAGTKRPIKA